MERIKLLITLDLDPETGETVCVDRQIINDDIKSVKKTSKKSSKKVADEETTPKLVLEAAKYTLNSAAIELLGIEAGERLDIKYEKQGTSNVPIFGTGTAFGTPENGNKLTKSNTVACRGKANDELRKYGTEFTIVAHESKSGLFKLVGDNQATQEITDINVSLPNEDLTIPADTDDFDLGELIEDTNNFDFSL